MRAVIHQVSLRPEVGMQPIAGRPFIARQLQWLRDHGCERIAVEIGTEPACLEMARWLTDGDALGLGVAIVLSNHPLGPREVARRAGFAESERFLALPGDVLGGGDLGALMAEEGPAGLVARIAPPSALPKACAGYVQIMGTAGLRPRFVKATGAWAVRSRSLRDALEVSSSALSSALPTHEGSPAIQIHAAEVSPGVWVARGASISADATVVGPVLIGADAVVQAGASVGPRTLVGDRAVVRFGARIANAMVSPGTIIGEGVEFTHASVAPGAVSQFPEGEPTREFTIDNTDMLDARSARRGAGVVSRMLAVVAATVLVVLLLPVLIVLFARAQFIKRAAARRPRAMPEVVTGMLDIVGGTRTWIGLSPLDEHELDVSEGLYNQAAAAPCGLIDVENVLVPRDADLATRFRVRAWYAHAKSTTVDAGLLMRRLRGKRATELV